MHWPIRMTDAAAQVDALFWFVLAVTGVWLVAAEAYLLFCLWRFREGTQKTAWQPRSAAFVLVGLGTAVLACDLAIEARSVPVWKSMKEQMPPAEIEVRAFAKQFRWRFVYPGPDREFGSADDRELDSELHVPANATVRIVLRSEDVIHSFFVPAARLKQDVLPGREGVVWFRPERAGRFEIACAELCGFAHYTMRAVLFVHDEPGYKQWLEQEWGSSSAGREDAGSQRTQG